MKYFLKMSWERPNGKKSLVLPHRSHVILRFFRKFFFRYTYFSCFFISMLYMPILRYLRNVFFKTVHFADKISAKLFSFLPWMPYKKFAHLDHQELKTDLDQLEIIRIFKRKKNKRFVTNMNTIHLVWMIAHREGFISSDSHLGLKGV